MDTVYLNFSKAFDAVIHKILTMMQRKHVIDEQIVRWIEKGETGRTQRVVSGAVSHWRHIIIGVSQGQYWVRSCSASLSMTWMKDRLHPYQVR